MQSPVNRMISSTDRVLLKITVLSSAPAGVSTAAIIVSEIDSDGDGTIDRWEYPDHERRPRRVGFSRHGGPPDLWEVGDGRGGVLRREFDDDRDGRVDRAEALTPEGTVYAQELDTNGDGRLDRRIRLDASGAVLGVEADPDGRGDWRRLEGR